MSKARFKEVSLDFPIKGNDDEEIAQVVVHRMTAGEVRDYISSKGDPSMFTMIRTKTGRSLKPEELDLLDDDDALKVEEVVQDFLPLRLMGVMGGAPEQIPDSGEDTLQSSPQNSPDSEALSN